MKNIIVVLFLVALVLSPVISPVPVLAASASDTQKDLLIQLLLEKVKVLQLELQALLNAEKQPVKVEINDQNTDYKKAVKSLVDALEENEDSRKLLLKKLEENQCARPYRVMSRKVTTFKCLDLNPTFSLETPLDEIIPLSSKSKDYIKDIQDLDTEIKDLNFKITSLKTRYGISS